MANLDTRMGWMDFSKMRKMSHEKQYSIYTKYFNENPNNLRNIDALNEMAIACKRLNKLDEALTFCQKILTADPNDALVHIEIGSIYRRQSEYELAEKHFEKALDYPSTLTYALTLIGWLKIETGDISKAILHLERAEEREPNNTSTLRGLGTAYLTLGNFVKARGKFAMLLELEPDNLEAHCGLAQIEMAMGNWKTAGKILKNAPGAVILEDLNVKSLRLTNALSDKDLMFPNGIKNFFIKLDLKDKITVNAGEKTWVLSINAGRLQCTKIDLGKCRIIDITRPCKALAEPLSEKLMDQTIDFFYRKPKRKNATNVI
jgi:Flp pilus assembly protein TadD